MCSVSSEDCTLLVCDLLCSNNWVMGWATSVCHIPSEWLNSQALGFPIRTSKVRPWPGERHSAHDVNCQWHPPCGKTIHQHILNYFNHLKFCHPFSVSTITILINIVLHIFSIPTHSKALTHMLIETMSTLPSYISYKWRFISTHLVQHLFADGATFPYRNPPRQHSTPGSTSFNIHVQRRHRESLSGERYKRVCVLDGYWPTILVALMRNSAVKIPRIRTIWTFPYWWVGAYNRQFLWDSRKYISARSS